MMLSTWGEVRLLNIRRNSDGRRLLNQCLFSVNQCLFSVNQCPFSVYRRQYEVRLLASPTNHAIPATLEKFSRECELRHISSASGHTKLPTVRWFISARHW
jgi:hypothetical protein